jgi:hypothetical protein
MTLHLAELVRGIQESLSLRRGAAERLRLQLQVRELGPGSDVEFAEYLDQVVLHGALADEQTSGDLPVGEACRGEPGDLGFLRGELGGCIRCPRAGMLAGRLELDLRSITEGVDPEFAEEAERRAQLDPRVEAPALPPQPFAVEQLRARQLDP